MPAGDVLTRPGRRADVLVARDELVLFAFEMEPHTDGAGPHLHRAHVDSFYVLEGELEVTLDGDTRQLRPGELATVPPKTVHAFRNASGGRVRFLNLHTPGMRFDEYIRRMDAGERPTPADYDSYDPE
jgi:quercetin dioxygenase-like cupin family protein